MTAYDSQKFFSFDKTVEIISQTVSGPMHRHRPIRFVDAYFFAVVTD